MQALFVRRHSVFCYHVTTGQSLNRMNRYACTYKLLSPLERPLATYMHTYVSTYPIVYSGHPLIQPPGKVVWLEGWPHFRGNTRPLLQVRGPAHKTRRRLRGNLYYKGLAIVAWIQGWPHNIMYYLHSGLNTGVAWIQGWLHFLYYKGLSIVAWIQGWHISGLRVEGVHCISLKVVFPWSRVVTYIRTCAHNAYAYVVVENLVSWCRLQFRCGGLWLHWVLHSRGYGGSWRRPTPAGTQEAAAGKEGATEAAQQDVHQLPGGQYSCQWVVWPDLTHTIHMFTHVRLSMYVVSRALIGVKPTSDMVSPMFLALQQFAEQLSCIRQKYCIFQVGCPWRSGDRSVLLRIIGNHYTRILGVGHYSGLTETLLSLSSMDNWPEIYSRRWPWSVLWQYNVFITPLVFTTEELPISLPGAVLKTAVVLAY